MRQRLTQVCVPPHTPTHTNHGIAPLHSSSAQSAQSAQPARPLGASARSAQAQAAAELQESLSMVEINALAARSNAPLGSARARPLRLPGARLPARGGSDTPKGRRPGHWAPSLCLGCCTVQPADTRLPIVTASDPPATAASGAAARQSPPPPKPPTPPPEPVASKSRRLRKPPTPKAADSAALPTTQAHGPTRPSSAVPPRAARRRPRHACNPL